MRKFVLIAALAVAAVGANAQNWSKGDVFTGAQIDNLSINHTSYKGHKETTFGLAVNAGYFFTNRLALDITAGIDTINTKRDEVKTKGTVGTFGAGLRVYPVGNLFARVGYDLAAAKGTNPSNYVGLTVGYDVFLSKRVFVTPAVYYKKGLKNKDTLASNNFGLQAGFGVRF